MATENIYVMRIERSGNSARVAVGDFCPTEEGGNFVEEYSRADHNLSENRHERLSAIAWVINGCSGISRRPIEAVLISKKDADELLPLLRGDDPHEDLLLNFEMIGYKPDIRIEDGVIASKRASAPKGDIYLYIDRLSGELKRGYHEKAGGFTFRLFTGNENEFERQVQSQAADICEKLKTVSVCESEITCRMFKKIWLLKAKVSRAAYNRICLPTDLLESEEKDICEVSICSYDHHDMNGAIDFFRQERTDLLLSEAQKEILREAFALLGEEAKKEPLNSKTVYLKNFAAVLPGEKTMSSSGNSPLAQLNHRFGIMRELEVYACISDSYTAGVFKSGTIITELGIFAAVGFPKKNQFFSWYHLMNEGIRQENNQYEKWADQTDVRTRVQTPVTGTVHAYCGELYVLLDAFVSRLRKSGYGE